jgi:hypothetical protein
VNDPFPFVLFARGLEPDMLFLLKDRHHLHLGGDGIPYPYRTQKFQFLLQVNGPRAGQLIPDYRGDKSSQKHPVGDSGLEVRISPRSAIEGILVMK